jgi:hypothetical protein
MEVYRQVNEGRGVGGGSEGWLALNPHCTHLRSELRSGGPPSQLILRENCRLFGMLRIRADENHLILHAVYKTVGSTFAQECSLEVAGIVLVANGVRVVDGGNEVADIADAVFHDIAELHATLCSGPATSHQPLDYAPCEEPNQSGRSNY